MIPTPRAFEMASLRQTVSLIVRLWTRDRWHESPRSWVAAFEMGAGRLWVMGVRTERRVLSRDSMAVIVCGGGGACVGSLWYRKCLCIDSCC